MNCKNEDCATNKPVFSRGLCQACYYRFRRNGTVERRYKSGGSHGICGVEGCDRNAHARGMCAKHYQQSLDPMRNVWKVLRSRAQGNYPDSWNDFGSFMAEVGDRPSPLHQLRRPIQEEPWSKSNAIWREPIRVSSTDASAYQRAWSYLRKFGLREADITRMREEQDDTCPICDTTLEATHPDTGKVIRICVDHDHVTGAVRGLLHDHCNKGIGQLGDSAENCLRAASYLTHHASKEA